MAVTKKKAPKKANAKSDALEIKKLKDQIASLEKANSELKHKVNNSPTKSKKSFSDILRTTGVAFFVTVSIVTFMLFNVTSWVKATLLDTDTFVETTRPLIEQPAVQQALQDEITAAIFENIDIEKELYKALPQDVAFLAGPLAGQVETFTSERIGEILSSNQLGIVWTATLQTIHGTLVDYITSEQSDGVLNINELYSFASEQLQDSQIAFLLNRQLPDSVGQITLVELSYFDEVKATVGVIDRLPIILLITSALSLIAALLLARNMKRTLVITLVLSFIMTVSTLFAIDLSSFAVANQVDPEFVDASKEIYAVITEPLVIRTEGYLALIGIILTLLFVTSKIKAATTVRAYLSRTTQSILKKTVPAFNVPSWLDWTIQSCRVLCWTIFFTLLVVLGLRIPPHADQLLTALLIATIVSLIVYIAVQSLAAAKSKNKK